MAQYRRSLYIKRQFAFGTALPSSTPFLRSQPAAQSHEQTARTLENPASPQGRATTTLSLTPTLHTLPSFLAHHYHAPSPAA